MAGKIPQHFIDELMQRVDIVDVIDARVPLKKAGKEYQACCPFHNEKTPSFTVSPNKQFYHCFGCGAHGTAVGFLMEYENLSFPEAVETLADQFGMQVPREEGYSAPREDTGSLTEALEQAEKYYRQQLREPSGREAVDYLKSRGLDGKTAALFGIGFAPPGWDNLLSRFGRTSSQRETLFKAGMLIQKDGSGFYDRFRRRIMFPIHNYRGQLVGFGGRAMGDDTPKYLNSPETPLFHKGRDLYGLYQGRDAIKDAGRAVIVEGYMDVVSLAQFDVGYAVATLGTATTQSQLERLFRFTSEIVFCFDGDQAGRKAAWRGLENALESLKEGRIIRFLFMPEGEDPDTLVRKEGAEGFEQRLQQAQSLDRFFLDTLSRGLDLSRMDEKTRLAATARPYLQQIPEGAYRDMLVDQIYRISGQDMRQLTDRPKPQNRRPEATKSPLQGPSAQPGKSKIARALAFALQNPELASIPSNIEFLIELSIPGAELLHDVLRLIQSRPGMNTGAILEHYHGSRHFNALSGLASWQHLLDDTDIKTEFTALLDDLDKQRRDIHIQELLNKARAERLTPDEQQLLNELLTAQK